MVVPGLVFIIAFKYAPLSGIVIAFQDFSVFRGVAGSDWVGLKHFQTIFAYPDFLRILWNTFRLSLEILIFGFPVPIILAILINEVRSSSLKRTVQSTLYIPHFLSWVIIGGLVYQIGGMNGVLNTVRKAFGMDPILIIQMEKYFDPIIIITGIWKEAGWGTIVYLAAISGINPELYEAAIVDGASKFRRIIRITVPLIIPTAVILFLLRLGRFLDIGFDRIYQFLTPLTYRVGDIIATYNFRVGILQGKYSITAALGLFQSLVGVVLIVSFNRLSRSVSESGGLW